MQIFFIGLRFKFIKMFFTHRETLLFDLTVVIILKVYVSINTTQIPEFTVL